MASPNPAKGRLAVALLLLMSWSLLAQPVAGGCTNYEDYLHWVRTQILLDLTGTPFVEGTVMYAPTTSGLAVFDLSNDSNPVPITSLPLAFDYWSIDVRGGLAALAGAAGLALVDVSDPANPQLLSEADPDAALTESEVVLGEGYAYLTTTSSTLLVVDVTDPAAPVAVNTVVLPGPGVSPLFEPGTLYLGAGNYFVLLSLPTPSAPTIRSTLSVDTFYTTRYVDDIAKSGTDIFVITRHNIQFAKLQVIDVSSPSSPVKTSEIVTVIPGTTAWNSRVAYAAGVVYVGHSTYHYLMYRFDDPGLTAIGYLPYKGGNVGDGGHPGGMNIFGANLYITGWYPFGSTTGYSHVISVQSPSPMTPVGSVATSGDAQSVAVVAGPDKAGSLAYVADGAGGLQIINIDDPQAPYVVGTVDTPGFATDVAVAGNRAYLADGSAGLQIIDITTPATPTILGTVDTPGTAVNLAVADTVAYVADGDFGLQLINVSENQAPAIITAADTPGYAQGVKLVGSLCCVADGLGGLVVLDVSDPDNPDIIGGVKSKALSGATKVDVRGNYAYVTDAASGLTVVDITNPVWPVEAGASATEAAAQDVQILGVFAFVADDSKGMKIIDVSNPDSPAIVGNAQVPANSKGVFVNGEFAYVAAGSGGLQICPTQCGYDEDVLADFTVDMVEAFYPVTVHFTNTTVGYGLSYAWDFGDGIGTSTEQDPVYTFTSPGGYNVTLTATNGTNTDVSTLEVSALTEPPTITRIADVPDDQGGFVYVDFFRSGYDSDGLKGLELYTVERLDNDVWVAVATTGAYRRSYYSVLARTQGDGDVAWTTQFRVIAHMDEGNWVSTPGSGCSMDNIAPAAPANVTWLDADRLGWDPVEDHDFAYYRIYGSATGSIDEAVQLGTTVQNTFTLASRVHPWYLVSTVDGAGLESSPSAPQAASGVPGVPSVVELYPAAPNPFNPATRIDYFLPASGPVDLVVFDMRGRRVCSLVHESLPAGRHSAVWRGRDDAGQRVSSGTYFYRLEVGNVSLTRRMALVK